MVLSATAYSAPGVTYYGGYHTVAGRPCAEMYSGAKAASEPETVAIQGLPVRPCG